MGIQGSFYVPVKAVSENTVLDVNKIHFTLAGQLDKAYLVRTIESQLDKLRADHAIEPFDDLVQKFAKPSRHDTAEVMLIKNLLQHGLPLEIRSRIADELFVQTVGMDEASFSRELYMSTEQVKTMQRHGMHIGCHGYNHFGGINWIGLRWKTRSTCPCRICLRLVLHKTCGRLATHMVLTTTRPLRSSKIGGASSPSRPRWV